MELGDEIRIDLIRCADGSRSIRLTHIPTGLAVEGKDDSRSLVDRRNELLAELREKIERGC